MTRKYRRLDSPRLLIRFKNGEGEVRSVGIPLHISRQTRGILVRLWNYKHDIRNIWLKKDEKLKIPQGYKWKIKSIAVSPEDFKDYIRKALKLTEEHLGELLSAHIRS